MSFTAFKADWRNSTIDFMKENRSLLREAQSWNALCVIFKRYDGWFKWRIFGWWFGITVRHYPQKNVCIFWIALSCPFFVLISNKQATIQIGLYQWSKILLDSSPIIRQLSNTDVSAALIVPTSINHDPFIQHMS